MYDQLERITNTTDPALLTREEKILISLKNPYLIQREINNRSFYEFLEYMWPEVSSEDFKSNWHIPYLCEELQKLAENVAVGKPKEYDLIINVPPGTTKTIICSIMFPAWCWTRWYWMRFITLSYSAILSLESAEFSRDLIRSERFKQLYPDVIIKVDKDTKTNFRVVKNLSLPGRVSQQVNGGNRYSTSVGGTLTGFHGHILIWDDPLNPQQAISEVELTKTNRWLDQTLSTRKVDKKVSVIIGIMQRLHQNDPTGYTLAKVGKKVKHISLPAELDEYRHTLKPPSLEKYYRDGLLDPVRMPREVLDDMKTDLGQYGYAGQMGQDPTPPKGGMFQVDKFSFIDRVPEKQYIIRSVRYWDKAGTKEKFGMKTKVAWTVGTKMHLLANGRWVISDVVRGRWESNEREEIIRQTAEADGQDVRIYTEQEPGSGGKESAQSTIINLAGFSCEADLPHGDKIYRADPYSVQVNNGNVLLLTAVWNHEFIEEHRFFPFSTYKDQVDSAAGAFSKLIKKKIAGPLGGSDRR